MERRTIPDSEIDRAIEMLRTHVTEVDLDPVVAVLEEFKGRQDDPAMLDKVRAQLNTLGPIQGAILTYAPFLIVVLSDDPHDTLI